MNVKQDGIDLYGFADTAELDMFKLLISVSNVGPKLAISVLSTFKVDDICLYIANGDSKALSKASGVGLKSAQRIVLELKDKVSAGSTAVSRDNSSEDGMSTDGFLHTSSSFMVIAPARQTTMSAAAISTSILSIYS